MAKFEPQAEIPVSCVGQLDVRAAEKAAYKFGQSGTQAKQEQERALLQNEPYAINLAPYLSLDENAIKEIMTQFK